MENKLRQAGFTQKEIKFVAHWVEKEKSSYLIVLRQLRRVFILGVIVRLLLIGFCVYSYSHDSEGGFYSSLFAAGFTFLVAEFFAPFYVGAKVFLYLRREKAS